MSSLKAYAAGRGLGNRRDSASASSDRKSSKQAMAAATPEVALATTSSLHGESLTDDSASVTWKQLIAQLFAKGYKAKLSNTMRSPVTFSVRQTMDQPGSAQAGDDTLLRYAGSNPERVVEIITDEATGRRIEATFDFVGSIVLQTRTQKQADDMRTHGSGRSGGQTVDLTVPALIDYRGLLRRVVGNPENDQFSSSQISFNQPHHLGSMLSTSDTPCVFQFGPRHQVKCLRNRSLTSDSAFDYNEKSGVFNAGMAEMGVKVTLRDVSV